MSKAEQVLEIARQFLFVREAAGNKNTGRWVEAIQRIGGTTKGQPWCMCFVSMVLGIAYAGKPPITYTAGCDAALAEARKLKILYTDPEPGDVFLLLASPNDAIHTGFVTAVSATRIATIEGNASDPTKPATREGWGVFERPLDHSKSRKRGPQYVYIRHHLKP